MRYRAVVEVPGYVEMIPTSHPELPIPSRTPGNFKQLNVLRAILFQKKGEHKPIWSLLILERPIKNLTARLFCNVVISGYCLGYFGGHLESMLGGILRYFWEGFGGFWFLMGRCVGIWGDVLDFCSYKYSFGGVWDVFLDSFGWIFGVGFF